MSNFVVNPSSLSESEFFDDLKNFLDSRPDAAKWEVFFESQTGVTLLKFIQGMASYFAIKATLGRREAFLFYAQNRSSVVGGSQFQGYSAFRGRNPTLTLTFTPDFTGTVQYFSVIGSIDSAEIVSLETKVVNEGVPTSIKCIVGNKLTSTVTANSDEASFFRYEGNGRVSDDLRITVDGQDAKISENILDLQDDFFFVQTNAVGAVDVFSLNNFNNTAKFDTNDDIVLEYIELRDSVFDDDEVEIDIGLLTGIQRDSIYREPESLDSIRTNAPLQNQVRDVIRAREDQPKQLRIVDPTIIDSTGEDVSAAVMRLYYLRKDRILFTQSQIQSLVDSWDRYRPHGIKPPLIEAPTRKPLIIKVDATLEDNVVGTPESDTRGILDKYVDDLEAEINLANLEKQIEQLDTIKIARPTYDGTTWSASSKYETGQHIKPTTPNDKVYQVQEILYFSSSTEPTWPTNEGGETVIDGDVVWESIPKNDTAGFSDWQADTPYRVGDQVKPTTDNGFVFVVSRVINKSGGTEPTWPALGGSDPSDLLGDMVDDGDIKWISRPLQGSPNDWQANKEYVKGDVVVATSPANSDTVGVMFQVFAYLGTSGSSEPTFPTVKDQTVVDNNLRYVTQSPDQLLLESGRSGYFTVDLDFNAL